MRVEWRETENDFTSYYVDILSKVNSFGVPLVDNSQFLAWAAGEREYTGTRLSPQTRR